MTRRPWGRAARSSRRASRYTRVAADVDFGQGGSPAKQVYTLTPEGAGTKVSWSMDVDLGMNPIGRYFGLGFDAMIGKDFDKGLALLKTFAEGLPKADFAGLEIEAASVEPVTVAYVPASSARDDAAIAAAIAKAYGEVGAFMRAQKLNQSGAPITIDTGSSDTGYLFDAAIPVDRLPATPVSPDSRVQLKQTYGGKVLKVALRGPYSQIPGNLRQDRRLHRRARHRNRTATPGTNSPTIQRTVKESEMLTNIYFPIK